MRATIIAQQQQQERQKHKEEDPLQHIPPILHSNCRNVPFAAIKPNDSKSTTTTPTITTSNRRRRTTTTTINAIATTTLRDTSNSQSNHNRRCAIINSSCCHCGHKKYYETYRTPAKTMRLKGNLIRSSRNGRTKRLSMAAMNTNWGACSGRPNAANVLSLPCDGQPGSLNNGHCDVIDLINYDDDYRIMQNGTKNCCRHHRDDEAAAPDTKPFTAGDIYYHCNGNQMTNSCSGPNSRRSVVPQPRRRNNKLRNPQLVMPIDDMQSEGLCGKVITTTLTTTTTTTGSCNASRLENVVQLPTTHKAYGNATALCEVMALNDGEDANDDADDDKLVVAGGEDEPDYDYYYCKEISQTTTLVCSNSSSCSVCNTGSHSIRCNRSGGGGSRCFKENSDINRTTVDQDVAGDQPQQLPLQQQTRSTPVIESDEPKDQCSGVRQDKGVSLERVMRTSNTNATKADVADDGDSCQGSSSSASIGSRSGSCRSGKHHNTEKEPRPQGGAGIACRSRRRRLRRELHDLLPVLEKMQFANSCTTWARWSSSSMARLLLTVLAMFTLTTSGDCWTGRQDVPSNCTFPARWEGSWFLSGYQQSIHIKGSQFSYRGRCVASDGNKYLIVDEKGCHRCLVIYEKHKNVLQYKENFCKGRETLQNLCDQIPGDALLYSMFRESAEPVKCPLRGPFVFTYNSGHGECKNPVSNIESCTEDSRLLLSFQACHDVQGTESTVEELTCLATWKDGNARYLVGLVSHHHAISNEERYRCFVYEKISSLLGGPSMISSKDAEYKLAQSGDATCNGLDSAEVGSRIMSLRKPPLADRCDFPAWFKGPRHWHALMGNAIYTYHSNDGSVQVIKPNGYMETRALCEQINKQTATEMMAVVHYTTGCQSGFMCMMFYRRDTHVIEIQTGKQAVRLEDACAPDHFDVHKMPYITLLANSPDPQICPMEGLYNLRGAIGPPDVATRHKRNHSNKLHGFHGHHHHEGRGAEGDATADGSAFQHKSRRGTLSFRNSDRGEHSSWHANTRGLPVRSRRDALSTTTTSTAPTTTAAATTAKPSKAKEEAASMETSTATEKILPANDTNVALLLSGDSAAVGLRGERSRRDAPVCITNYKAQRQLWVGCTEPNVIDVRPLCTDDGHEEYLCHGSWSENATVYIIARHKGTNHAVCISYRPTEGSAAKLVIGDACYRGTQKPPEHHIVANLSVFGKCGETGNTASRIETLRSTGWLGTLAVAILATSLGNGMNVRALYSGHLR